MPSELGKVFSSSKWHFCASHGTFETLTSALKDQKTGIQKEETVCTHPSWQGKALVLQGISELGSVWSEFLVHVFFFHLEICLLEELELFLRLSRIYGCSVAYAETLCSLEIPDMFMLHFQNRHTECICSKSDVFWAVAQKPPVEPIWVFSIIPTWTRSTEVFYNKHVVFTVCENLQSFSGKLCWELWDCNLQE